MNDAPIILAVGLHHLQRRSRGVARRPDSLLEGNTVNVSRRLDSPRVTQTVCLYNRLADCARQRKQNEGHKDAVREVWLKRFRTVYPVHLLGCE